MDLGAAYSELKPLLFEALSRLARQGFVVRPDDALDLIHDFLAYEFEGVQQNYDTQKGGFNGYAYKAFVRFARSRIMQMQRFQASLVDPQALDLISAPDINHELQWSRSFEKDVTRAIDLLPNNEASLLLTYLNSRVPSERLLAQGFSISRYETRQILLRALGRVVTQLARPPGIAEKDWSVARALWRDQMTIGQAGLSHNLTSHQVRVAQARVTKFLDSSLRNVQRLRRYTRGLKMKGERYTVPARQLLSRVLYAVGNRELLEELRNRAEEVISAFRDDHPDVILEAEGGELDSEWLAEVYEALAGSAKLPREEQELIDAFFEANVQEEQSVGEAFQQVLWFGLSADLHDLSRWFKDEDRIPSSQMEELLNDPSVRGGLPEASLLLVYGVTPLTIFLATEAVTSVLERLEGYGWIEPGSTISLYPDRVEASSDLLTVDLITAEIYTSARCSEGIARSLYSWLVGVARERPLLYDTYEATVRDSGVQLHRRESSMRDLFQRWRAMPEPEPEREQIVGVGVVEQARVAGNYMVPMGAIIDGIAATAASSYTSHEAAPQKLLGGTISEEPNWLAVLMRPVDCPGEEYLQYGVASGIARSLSMLPGVVVKLPQHVPFHCGQVNDVKHLQELGKSLGVKTVLAGWVEPSDNQFSCQARLVDTEAGHVWQGAYNPQYGALTSVAKDISHHVADHLGIYVSRAWNEHLNQAGTDDAEAQKFYMKGLHYLSTWLPDGIQSALWCYDQATEKVPDFSLAYAGKADCYNLLSDYTLHDTPWKSIRRAKADAYEALEYTDALPEAYAALAFAHTRYWKWGEAEDEFKRALALNPSYVVARKWYALHLTAQGRMPEAITQLTHADNLEPSSPIINAALGVTYFFARQYEVAAQYFQSALACNPSLQLAHYGLGIAYAHTGRHAEAIDTLQNARPLFPESTRGSAALASVLGQTGKKEQARQILRELKAKSERQYVSPYGLAVVHAALAEPDAALENLNNALEQKDPSLILLNVDPRFDGIRGNERFQTIVGTIGLHY